MGMQPILPVSVSVKKIKGVARQHYSNGEGVVRCEQTSKTKKTKNKLTVGVKINTNLPYICVAVTMAHNP